jgi:hypothetical protein
MDGPWAEGGNVLNKDLAGTLTKKSLYLRLMEDLQMQGILKRLTANGIRRTV